MSTQSPKIAWLVPCHNEAITIGVVVEDIKRLCPKSEVHVYDNCSSDDTLTVAQDAGAIGRREFRKGKGSVVRRMFFDVDADIYIMLDGDNTYDVSSWQKLVAPIVSGEADMVVGARLKTHGQESSADFTYSAIR